MARKAPSTAFKPGQSGNPNGRPKIVKAVEEVAREHTDLAMRTLAEICRNTKAPPAARVTGRSILLDRGWGKARQEHNLKVTVDPAQLSDAELATIIASAAAVAPDEDGTRH